MNDDLYAFLRYKKANKASSSEMNRKEMVGNQNTIYGLMSESLPRRGPIYGVIAGLK